MIIIVVLLEAGDNPPRNASWRDECRLTNAMLVARAVHARAVHE